MKLFASVDEGIARVNETEEGDARDVRQLKFSSSMELSLSDVGDTLIEMLHNEVAEMEQSSAPILPPGIYDATIVIHYRPSRREPDELWPDPKLMPV